MNHMEAIIEYVNGAELVEGHSEGPGEEWGAVYVWHGGLTVNVYGVTPEGWEPVDVFTYMEKPTRGEVLSRIAEHWREAQNFADALERSS